MRNNAVPRKDLQKILLVNWSRFTAETIKVSNSVLITGVNGTGKSTVLDAVSYAVSGNRDFNSAAQDRDRSVRSYVRGDTKSSGARRFLRSDAVVSYIALEFWSAQENAHFVAGVCVESKDELSDDSFWFVRKNAVIDDFNFYVKKDNSVTATVRSELTVKGERMKGSEFIPGKRGVEQVMRALGLRCEKSDYAPKLLKMMSFKPENNTNDFIRQNVLKADPVSAIEMIRESKRNHDKLQSTYANIMEQQRRLDELENLTTEYEKSRRNAEIKRFIALYQNVRRLQIEKALQQEALENGLLRLERLNSEKESAEEAAAEKNSAYHRAQTEFYNSDFDGKIRSLQSEIDDLTQKLKRAETEISKIEQLQTNVDKLLDDPELNLSGNSVIRRLSAPEVDSEEKYSAVLEWRKTVSDAGRGYDEQIFGQRGELKKIEDELSEIRNNIRKLEDEKSAFPKPVEDSRRKLRNKLREMGADVKVNVLAELVSEVKRPEWQDAIEAFMGWDRYSFVVDDRYVDTALSAYKACGISSPRLILSDKIRETDVKPDSAASVLAVPKPEARKYINYRLNNIHLCGSIEELHDHPTGGITADGYRAVGYSMDRMRMSEINYTLGAQAKRLELDRQRSLADRKQAEKNAAEDVIRTLEALLSRLTAFDFGKDYRFESIAEKPQLASSISQRQEACSAIMSSNDYIALSDALELAKQEFNAANSRVQGINEEIGGCKTGNGQYREEIDRIAGQEFNAQRVYGEYEIQHLDIKREALSEYEKHLEGHDDGIIYSQNTIDKADSDKKRKLEDLEKRQFDFCRFVPLDMTNCGENAIAFYRKYRADLVNVKAEETKQRIEEAKHNLQSAFVNDFVGQIKEKIDAARKEIFAINDELAELPFGSSIYEFECDDRPDKAAFFRIAEKFDPNRAPEQLDLFSSAGPLDDSTENDISEFLDMILHDDDGAEFEDYRNYLKYDMAIKNRLDADEKYELSKKQGSASNGEKQTPYFIILAASLMQCYPRSTNCARLAFVDEAFAALSIERIEQMVNYFEMNGFQVLYAAPPEKINSIGSHIDSTVSLVNKGRYTKAVEGLVDDIIEEPDRTSAQDT